MTLTQILILWIVIGISFQLYTKTKMPNNTILAVIALFAGPLYSACNVAGCCNCDFNA